MHPLSTFIAAFAAGGLSTLSPCVLPLVPILIAGALSSHRFGVLALASGLALSYSAVGVAIASVGSTIGLDPDVVRQGAAVALLAFGILMVSDTLQHAFAARAAVVSRFGNDLLGRVDASGLRGQFLVGTLLGVVWSPCVGPTLGAAITLASQGQSLPQVALTMALFGVGAALPLIALALLSRETIQRLRGRMLAAGTLGKQFLGVAMILVGILILTGANRPIEKWLLEASPDWLVRVTTSV
jgi:cytochrome c-type biogenesis protein